MTHHRDCRVLIVEDEYFLAEDLASALRALGFEVVGPVYELSKAMSVQPGDFDVALCDINLRGSSVYPLTDKLMRIGKPFVFTTGYGADAIPERFQHVPRWEKPYELDKVTTDIAELCHLALAG